MAQDLIGVREAASVLGLSPSTVSRYLVNYPELNRAPDGKRPRVDPAELRRHRADNVNGLKSGNHAGRLFDQVDEDLEAEEEAEPVPRTAAAAPTGNLQYSKAKAAREAVLAQKAKIELDVMLRELVPVGEVQDALAEAAQVLQGELLSMRAEVAEQLATMTDPTEIEALLKAEHRKALERMEQKFKGLAAEEAEHAA